VKKVNYEEIMKEMEELQRKMMKSFFSEYNNLEELIRKGELEGSWEFQPIEKPGVKGFILRGNFGTPSPFDKPNPLPQPFNPVRPLRPPMEKPREPLYDLRNNIDNVTVYLELPGVEEDQIQITPSEGGLELEAGDFNTVIQLPKTELVMDKMTKEYKNGVLTISIPKSSL
jgi:HSP20 family molecular chaperone IbpA